MGLGFGSKECLSLRVKDIDFERGCLTIRAGKGNKDRETVLPEKLVEELRHHIAKIKPVYDRDRDRGLQGVSVPDALDVKMPKRGEDVGMVLGIPCTGAFYRPTFRPGRTVPHLSRDNPTSVSQGSSGGWNHQTRNHPYSASQFCDAPDREGVRYSNDPGVAGTLGRLHHDTL